MRDDPVWDVYDLFRTARLNVKYTNCRLHSLSRKNFWMELALSIIAPTSAVAGLALWQTCWGRPIWAVLGVLVSALAVAKPLLKLTDRIRRLEMESSGYRTLERDLNRIVIEIRQRKVYDAELVRMFREALSREAQLASGSVETKEDAQLKRACEEEVLRELPADYFFLPSSGTEGHAHG